MHLRAISAVFILAAAAIAGMDSGTEAPIRREAVQLESAIEAMATQLIGLDTPFSTSART